MRFVRVLSSVVLFSLCFSLIAAPTATSGMPAASYTYYGYVPSDMWRRVFNETVAAAHGTAIGVTTVVDPASIATSASLVVVGNHEATKVEVYTLPEGGLVREFTLGKLERATLALQNGTFFKLVSSRPTTVILTGGDWEYHKRAAGVSTFWTSTEGGYVGKEFIFVAYQPPTGYGRELPHMVYALQDSEVTVWDQGGSKVLEFGLKANKARWFSLSHEAVYRIESTGNIMVESFYIGEYWAKPLFLPAVEGGFIGRRFYGAGHNMEYMGQEQLSRFFILTSVEGLKATIVDLESGKKLTDGDITVPRDGNLSTHIKAFHVGVEADKPMMLMFKNTNFDGGGVLFAGLDAGQEAIIYIPAGKSFLFAGKETTVTVDDVMIKLPEDGVHPLWPGLHKISTTEAALIEVVMLEPYLYPLTVGGEFPEPQGLGTFGAVIPSVESLSVRNENLNLKPLVQEELPWLYIAAAAIPIALIIIWLAVRRGKRASQP